jgi:hypothetical protein
MKNHDNEIKRVLAVDPNGWGFGYAVLEGQRRLVDWGLRRRGTNQGNAWSLTLLKDLVDRYQPDILVAEDCRAESSWRHARVRQLIRSMLRLAITRRAKPRTISRAAVRQAFSYAGVSNKDRLAALLAGEYPELAPRLPPPRRKWTSEDARMSIFGAVALARAFYHQHEGGRRLIRSA